MNSNTDSFSSRSRTTAANSAPHFAAVVEAPDSNRSCPACDKPGGGMLLFAAMGWYSSTSRSRSYIAAPVATSLELEQTNRALRRCCSRTSDGVFPAISDFCPANDCDGDGDDDDEDPLAPLCPPLADLRFMAAVPANPAFLPPTTMASIDLNIR